MACIEPRILLAPPAGLVSLRPRLQPRSAHLFLVPQLRAASAGLLAECMLSSALDELCVLADGRTAVHVTQTHGCLFSIRNVQHISPVLAATRCDDEHIGIHAWPVLVLQAPKAELGTSAVVSLPSRLSRRQPGGDVPSSNDGEGSACKSSTNRPICTTNKGRPTWQRRTCGVSQLLKFEPGSRASARDVYESQVWDKDRLMSRRGIQSSVMNSVLYGISKGSDGVSTSIASCSAGWT